MADLSGFDATQVEPAASFEPVPAGKYLATIVESEMKSTKSGTGNYLQLTFEIREGPHQGRVLWSRLNLQNPNPTTVQIAQAELSSICRATGVLTPSDSVELHNLTKRPVTVGEVTCTVAGVEVSMPAGRHIAPGGSIRIDMRTPESGLPSGPIRGEVRVETNVPEHAVIAIPVDGTALR